MEEWRGIKGYEGRYKVSNKGNIMAYYKGNWVDKSIPVDKRTGYPYVVLYMYGERKKKFVHRLVAEAFVENTGNKPEVDHINGIRTDNRLENLRWATKKENRNNPVTIERLRIAFTGERSPHYGKRRSHKTCNRISKSLKESMKNKGKTGCLCPHSRPIHRYDLNGNYIDSFVGQTEASRVTGVHQGDISRVSLYKKKTAGGFIWRKFKVEHL